MDSYWVFPPVFLLAGGALLSLIFERLTARRIPPVLAILPTVVSFAALVVLFVYSGGVPLKATLFAWNPTTSIDPGSGNAGSSATFPSSITLAYYVDRWAAFLGAVGLLVGIGTQLYVLNWHSDDRSRHNWTHVCVLGTLAIFVSLLFSASFIALYVSWTAIGLCIYAYLVVIGNDVQEDNPQSTSLTEQVEGHGPQPKESAPRSSADFAERTLAITQLAAFMLLGGSILIERNANNELLLASFQSVRFGTASSLLMALAVAAFLGLYPFQSWLIWVRSLPSPVSALLASLPAIASVYLLGRLLPLFIAEPSPLFSAMLIALGLATVVVGAVNAWRATSFSELTNHAILAELGLVAASFSLALLHISGNVTRFAEADARAITASLLIFLNCVLFGAALAVFRLWFPQAEEAESPLHDRRLLISGPHLALLVVAWLSLIGLPLSLGFAAKWILYSASLESGLPFLIPISMIANGAIIVASLRLFDNTLFNRALSSDRNQVQISRLPLVAASILVIPGLALGLMPNQALYWIVQPATGPLLGAESAVVFSTGNAVGASVSSAITLALMLALVVFAFRAYPIPMAASACAATGRSTSDVSSSSMSNFRYTGLGTGIDIITTLLSHASKSDWMFSRLYRALNRASDVLDNVSERVNQSYYFPALVVLTVGLVFVFFG